MENRILKDISSGFIGELTHLHLKKAIEGLTPDIVRKKPSNLE